MTERQAGVAGKIMWVKGRAVLCQISRAGAHDLR